MKTTHFLVPVIGLALLASCHTEVTPAAIGEAQFLQLLDELRPVDIADAEKQRFGPEKDGGYVMIAGQDYDALYSYGIGRDMEFESHFVKENPIPVYLYDHTISGLPEENFLVRLFTGNKPRPSSLITWKPEGIGPRRTANLNSLQGHVTENGDAEKENLLLKMDVEGAEWPSLLETPNDVLGRFKQVVIELHGLGEKTGDAYENQVKVLRKLNKTFHLVHVHGNNYSNLRVVGNYKVPHVLEAAYVRKSDFVAVPSTTHYPMPQLDFPNADYRKDIILDFYPFAPEPSPEQEKHDVGATSSQSLDHDDRVPHAASESKTSAQ